MILNILIVRFAVIVLFARLSLFSQNIFLNKKGIKFTRYFWEKQTSWVFFRQFTEKLHITGASASRNQDGDTAERAEKHPACTLENLA